MKRDIDSITVSEYAAIRAELDSSDLGRALWSLSTGDRAARKRAARVLHKAGVQATPGPWVRDGGYVVQSADAGGDEVFGYCEFSPDVEHAAAWDPAAVLALVASLRDTLNDAEALQQQSGVPHLAGMVRTTLVMRRAAERMVARVHTDTRRALGEPT